MMYLLSIGMVIVFLMVLTHQHVESREILVNHSHGVIMRTYGKRRSPLYGFARIISKSAIIIIIGGCLL